MKKRIDIIYNTNEQEWALEAIAKKHGFTLTDNCYWVQIMRNQDGDSIVLTREDSEQAHDPVGRLIAILETTETETTETAETAQDERGRRIMLFESKHTSAKMLMGNHKIPRGWDICNKM